MRQQWHHFHSDAHDNRSKQTDNTFYDPNLRNLNNRSLEKIGEINTFENTLIMSWCLQFFFQM